VTSTTGSPLPLPLVIGAYAAEPATSPDREAFYAGLHERIGADGLEIPTQHLLEADGGSPAALAGLLRGRFTGGVVTAIPGTMRRLSADPRFGLASADAAGRRAALEYVRALRAAAEQVLQLTGEPSITRLQIQSAPSGAGDPDALRRSLAELADEGPIALVLEHCDAANDEVPGEKRFLPLAEEIAVAREAGLGITINWGRSAVETHDPGTPLRHVREAAGAGLLSGLMLSGAGGAASSHGDAWADAHLPQSEDEPTSAMDADRVRECLEAASGLDYVGVKVQAPEGADVLARLALIGRIVDTIRSAPGAPATSVPPAGH
jgi:hypothetical protein